MNSSFYKHLLGRPVDYRDMEALDPDFYKSLLWIVENDITGTALMFKRDGLTREAPVSHRGTMADRRIPRPTPTLTTALTPTHNPQPLPLPASAPAPALAPAPAPAPAQKKQESWT